MIGVCYQDGQSVENFDRPRSPLRERESKRERERTFIVIFLLIVLSTTIVLRHSCLTNAVFLPTLTLLPGQLEARLLVGQAASVWVSPGSKQCVGSVDGDDHDVGVDYSRVGVDRGGGGYSGAAGGVRGAMLVLVWSLLVMLNQTCLPLLCALCT